MDTTETAAITVIASTISGILSSFATARKVRNEGDALVQGAISQRTQQLFDNLSEVMDRQQKEINELKAGRLQLEQVLSECHKQHQDTAKQYNEALKRLEQLENALRASL